MLSFPHNFYAAGFFGAALVTVLSAPLWKRWCLRHGFMDDPGERKIHAAPIPLSGGFAVLTGLVVPSMLGAVYLLLALPQGHLHLELPNFLVYGFSRRALQLLALIFGAVTITLLGALDDKYELSPGRKFAGQLAVALLVASSGMRVTLFVPYPLFSYLITVLWILTITNAFNFLDNMNGLSGGLGLIACWMIAWKAAAQGQYLVALWAFLIAGALAGFLPWNYPKASMFLGDAGSHLVGFSVAVLVILPDFYSTSHPSVWAVLSPLLILAVPLTDLVWVVLWRWRAGKPFYIGDTNHLSHRLARLGLSRSTAVALLWLAAAAFGALSFLL